MELRNPEDRVERCRRISMKRSSAVDDRFRTMRRKTGEIGKVIWKRRKYARSALRIQTSINMENAVVNLLRRLNIVT